MNTTIVSIKSLYKIFGEFPQRQLAVVKQGISKTDLIDKNNHILALRDININIYKNSINIIMGLSGSGKSTLIRHINRLIEPTEGNIEIYGQDITKISRKDLLHLRRHKVSMVFQKFGLHPHKTVIENISYGLSVKNIDKKRAKNISYYWLKKMVLENFADKYPKELSGGMQQRVGLARALAADTEILLMDEPFSALDLLIREKMQNMLLRLQKELHKTIVFITHDLDEALKIGDRVMILKDGEIIQDDVPQQIILNPNDDHIIDFVKRINKAKIITLSTIARPGFAINATALKGDTTLEQALKHFTNSKEECVNVVDNNNNNLGIVNFRDVIAVVNTTEYNDNGYDTN